jgi:IS5 family transposase
MHNTGRSVHTESRQMLKVLGFVDAMQRRAQPGQPLSECQKRRNQRIASKRARVEHAFAGIRHLGGKFVRTIGQARATVAMTMMAACYNMKRLASFLHRGMDAFLKPEPGTCKAQVRPHTTKA